MNLTLDPNKKHLTFFKEVHKCNIKPEILEIAVVKKLIVKYGILEASKILTVVNLLVNKDIHVGVTEEKRLLYCKKDVGLELDISSCELCLEIVSKFKEASLDSYDMSLLVLEDILKDAADILRTTRIKIAIRRKKLEELDFSDIHDENIVADIQILMAAIEKDFETIQKSARTIIDINKSLKELKTKGNNSQFALGSNNNKDVMLTIFDN